MRILKRVDIIEKEKEAEVGGVTSNFDGGSSQCLLAFPHGQVFGQYNNMSIQDDSI